MMYNYIRNEDNCSSLLRISYDMYKYRYTCFEWKEVGVYKSS